MGWPLARPFESAAAFGPWNVLLADLEPGAGETEHHSRIDFGYATRRASLADRGGVVPGLEIPNWDNSVFEPAQQLRIPRKPLVLELCGHDQPQSPGAVAMDSAAPGQG